METALRADRRYERQLKDLQEAYGEAMLELRIRKCAVPTRRGREVIETIHQGLRADGITVLIAKLCRLFGLPRRMVYYKRVKSAPKVDPRFVGPMKAMI